ncbi:hypothetical protein LJC49_01500 [Ruminococcaceae bacterium OttesenSCG-928-I18]|nr:hypothetical protein [Ruminococcaceae bacterium OttesenSCG-928-I18]
MEFYPFPAVLRTEYNDICEHGTAQITKTGDAINFFGEFVPLVPLGQPAVVEWILGEKTLATFEGKVYLSSAQMLQIIEVNEEKLRTAKTLFLVNTSIPATVVPAQNPKAQPLPVEILFLSMGLLKLLVRENIEEGTELKLYAHIEFLTLRDLELKVRKRILFHKEETVLLCEIEGVSRENYIALSTYIAKLEKRKQGEEE